MKDKDIARAVPMGESEKFRENSAAVQAHLNITQSVIQRMAANSAMCKGWCIALVSAILVIVADKGKPEFTMIAFIPTLLFLALDTYYLSLEKRFRNSYNSFITKLHNDKLKASDLYAVLPSGKICQAICDALKSFAIIPFYATLLIMIILVKLIVVAPGASNKIEQKCVPCAVIQQPR